MKLKECFYLLGFRPRAKTYSHEVVEFQLPEDGAIDYAQWLHPSETRKTISQDVINELRTFLSEGDVAIDIGAHTGDTTIPLGLATGSEGCVLAFEPNSYVYSILQVNAQLNEDRYRIVPLNFAATENEGTFQFEYSDPGFCNGGRHDGVSKWKHGHAFELEVHGVNPQDYIREHFPELISRIRYIKIDTEGYDVHVLKTLTGIIEEQRPFLKIEVFKHLSDVLRDQLYDYLTNFGYQIHKVESETNYRGPQLSQADLKAEKTFDIFCVPANA